MIAASKREGGNGPNQSPAPTPCAHARALRRIALWLQNNSTLQALDVSNNMCMDKSWQKLLGHVVRGKPKA